MDDDRNREDGQDVIELIKDVVITWQSVMARIAEVYDPAGLWELL